MYFEYKSPHRKQYYCEVIFLKFEKDKHGENYFEDEDTTRYGEFISSYFAWIPLNKQKRRASELEKMTKKDEK